MISSSGSLSQNNCAPYRLDYKTGQSQLFSTSKANGESPQIWIPNAYILNTLQHRRPDDFLGFVITDVDDMNRSVQDVDNHLKPGVDPLHLDKPTLSKYRQEMICKGPGERTDMLSTLKEAVSAVRTIRGMAVEVDLFRILAPEFVEHVIFASMKNDGSWKKTLNLPKYADWKSGDLNNHPKEWDDYDLEDCWLYSMLAQPFSNNAQILISIQICYMMSVTLPDTPSAMEPAYMTRVEVHSARKK